MSCLQSLCCTKKRKSSESSDRHRWNACPLAWLLMQSLIQMCLSCHSNLYYKETSAQLYKWWILFSWEIYVLPHLLFCCCLRGARTLMSINYRSQPPSGAVMEKIWGPSPVGLMWASDWKTKRPGHLFSGFGCRSRWQSWQERNVIFTAGKRTCPAFQGWNRGTSSSSWHTGCRTTCLQAAPCQPHPVPHRVATPSPGAWLCPSPCPLSASQGGIKGLVPLSTDARSANVGFVHANEKRGKSRFTSGSAQW